MALQAESLKAVALPLAYAVANIVSKSYLRYELFLYTCIVFNFIGLHNLHKLVKIAQVVEENRQSNKKISRML
jgi:hypothetical protein